MLLCSECIYMPSHTMHPCQARHYDLAAISKLPLVVVLWCFSDPVM